MKVIESRAVRVVVQHEHCYNLEQVTWPPIGSPPDADELELKARELAETEVKAQGWDDVGGALQSKRAERIRSP